MHLSFYIIAFTFEKKRDSLINFSNTSRINGMKLISLVMKKYKIFPAKKLKTALIVSKKIIHQNSQNLDSINH